ncbi:MAG: general secretion pathway protein GspB [Pelovirga sp.]
MSFILDALRKAENKRRKQAGEELHTVYEPVQRKPARSGFWIVVGVIVLCANVVLVAWMVMSPRQPPPVVPLVQEEPLADRGPAMAVAQEPEAAPVTSAPGTALVRPVAPAPTGAGPAPLSPEPAATAEPPAQTGSEQARPLPAAAEVASEPDRIYRISELPAAVRARLPALQMPLHAYNPADAAASLVQINGRVLRAGESINSDLVLEDISAEGAILRIGGYRFLLSRRGG